MFLQHSMKKQNMMDYTTIKMAEILNMLKAKTHSQLKNSIKQFQKENKNSFVLEINIDMKLTDYCWAIMSHETED